MSRRHSPGTAAEIEGFLEGVEHRRRDLAPDDPSISARIGAARRAIAGRDWARAHELLVRVDEELAALRPEGALRERPRGLVGFTTRGPAEGPPDPEEDALTNRIVLVQRLLAVRRASGWPVDPWVRELGEAEAARRAGDLSRARRLVDKVHSELEARGTRRSGTP